MKFDKTKLQITPTDFDTAKDFERALAKALAASPMNIVLDNINAKNIFNSKISTNAAGEIIKSCLHLIISKEVEEMFFKCAERALYDKEKVDKEFFEKERSFYYPILFELIKVNVLPFFEGLSLKSGGLLEIITSFLERK